MTRIVLFAALAIGLFLRVHDIATNPPELFEDELSGAMSAWSVVTTGHDVIVDHLPLFTTRLGPQLPLYGLATVPFQAVLGHTVLAVRLPAVLFGVLDIALLYLLVRSLAGRRLATLAAATVAILPWAVQFSRIGWDNAAYPPLLLAGLVLLVGAIHRADQRRAIAAAALLGLSAYSYQIAIFMTPLFVAALVWPLRAKLRAMPRRAIALAAATGLLIAVPYVWRILTVPEFTERAARISTFANGINGETLARFVSNYLANLSPVFLFVSGDDNLRHGTGRGELLLVMLPFAIVGAASCVMRARRSVFAFAVIAWLALAPLPAAITDDGVPHAARGMLAIIPWAIVVAIGVDLVWRAIPRTTRAAAAVSFAILLLAESASYYWDQYERYPIRSAGAWEYGAARTMAAVRSLTPAGGTACIGTISYFTFPHYERWYLSDVPFRVVERDAGRCTSPGDVLALPAGDPAPASAREALRIDGPDGLPVVRIWLRQ